MKHLHPFEEETVPSGTADTMWLYAFNMARQQISRGREMVREYQENGSTQHWMSDMAREYVDRALWIMLPFKMAIHDRTNQELKAARRRVEQCEARFILTSCSGETCEDCERPLWQHVVTTLARYCPRDGRPYWQLVRAILADTLACPHQFATPCVVCILIAREALAPIARENRSETAKPAGR